MERIPELKARGRREAPELVWIGVRFTALERQVIADLCRRGAFSGIDEVVCAGLWQLARQFDVPITAFALGRGKQP